jgi:hypothetical protein
VIASLHRPSSVTMQGFQAREGVPKLARGSWAIKEPASPKLAQVPASEGVPASPKLARIPGERRRVVVFTHIDR